MVSRLPKLLGWTRHSYYLLSAFVLTCVLIIYIWWPLMEEYLGYMDASIPWYYYMDWLLLSIFLFMSLTIMAKADLRKTLSLAQLERRGEDCLTGACFLRLARVCGRGFRHGHSLSHRLSVNTCTQRASGHVIPGCAWRG